MRLVLIGGMWTPAQAKQIARLGIGASLTQGFRGIYSSGTRRGLSPGGGGADAQRGGRVRPSRDHEAALACGAGAVIARATFPCFAKWAKPRCSIALRGGCGRVGRGWRKVQCSSDATFSPPRAKPDLVLRTRPVTPGTRTPVPSAKTLPPTRERTQSMCGIAGLIGIEPDLANAAAERMRPHAAAHRGPDAGRPHLSAGLPREWLLLFHFVHTRLAIIDLLQCRPAAIRCSIPFPGSNRTIVFNGEIYNFHELRSELEVPRHPAPHHGHRYREDDLPPLTASGAMQGSNTCAGCSPMRLAEPESGSILYRPAIASTGIQAAVPLPPRDRQLALRLRSACGSLPRVRQLDASTAEPGRDRGGFLGARRRLRHGIARAGGRRLLPPGEWLRVMRLEPDRKSSPARPLHWKPSVLREGRTSADSAQTPSRSS